MSKTREYEIWNGMRKRCENPRAYSYADYGGRGISVHPEWMAFSAFIADMGQCPPDYTLERIDNNANYAPGNCVWASRTQQANNKRSNRRLTHLGVTKNLSEWVRATGLSRSTIEHRLERGWTVERALTTPRLQ